MRSIGVGYGGLEKMCGLLDMLKPMTQKNFDNLSNRIGDGAKVITERSMVDAAETLSNRIGDAANVITDPSMLMLLRRYEKYLLVLVCHLMIHGTKENCLLSIELFLQFPLPVGR